MIRTKTKYCHELPDSLTEQFHRLYWAVKADNIQAAATILAMCSTPIINWANFQGWTPLAIAVSHNCLQMVELLVENAADFNSQSPLPF